MKMIDPSNVTPVILNKCFSKISYTKGAKVKKKPYREWLVSY